MVHATEHARPDVAEARAAWQQTAPTWDPARLVFLDERVVYVKLCNFRFMAEGVIG